MLRSLHAGGCLGSRSGRAPSARTFWGLASSSTPATRRTGFTLVEMLIAMAITLVMMAAVATLFANVSSSVTKRRATIEMSNQMRHVRNVLQQDLQGATCPGLTWQRSDSNHGYIEIIEGQYRDSYPSLLTDGVDPPFPQNPELDPALSIIPRNNGATDTNGNGRIDANEWEAHYQSPDSFKRASGLGDYDDILMLTVRNENEPFVGRVPRVRDQANQPAQFRDWTYNTGESTLAEVVWFAIENPVEAENPDRFFGEPGMRTIYRRTLLIAPWVNPYLEIANPTTGVFTEPGGGKSFKAEPGLVRVLRNDDKDNVVDALAALVAFQDRYDLSVRLEWDHNLQRWKIMANTLGDLTKRENRFGHFGFHYRTGSGLFPTRLFPYPVISVGRGYPSTPADVSFVSDPEIGGPSGADATANIQLTGAPLGGIVLSYLIDATQQANNSSNLFTVRPLAYVNDQSGMSATARAMLNDKGEVVRVVLGPVPLWGTRRGEDVMMTDALAFDVRVYDPGAPMFGVRDDLTDPASNVGVIVEPSDPGWTAAYTDDPDNRNGAVSAIGRGGAKFPLVGQGAYVDMGYQYDFNLPLPHLHNPPVFTNSSATSPWFFIPRALSDVRGNQLAPGYAVYDTWSFHYENNGRDDDGDSSVDEGINGLDDVGNYVDSATGNIVQATIMGIDDVGERETAPPYDKPLRGAQVLVRAYERDSRAIRQVRVSQHFMPE